MYLDATIILVDMFNAERSKVDSDGICALLVIYVEDLYPAAFLGQISALSAVEQNKMLMNLRD